MVDDENPWTVWERNFIEQMVRLREARRMTQSDLARMLKSYGLPFHQPTVQRIEAGERPVRLNEAHLIAKVLGADLGVMTASGAPADREMRYVVDRLRRGSESAAEELSETLSEWLEDVEALAPALTGRLKASPGTRPDPVANWGLAWAAKVITTYYQLSDAWRHLGQIHGKPIGISSEEGWEMNLPSEDVIDALSSLCQNYMNPQVRRWSVVSSQELYALFSGESGANDDGGDEGSVEFAQGDPEQVAAVKEFLARIPDRSPAEQPAEIPEPDYVDTDLDGEE